jgi:hypothetical protein
MPCKVRYFDLESALEWASGDMLVDQAAFIDLETGKIYWTPDDTGLEELPEDLGLSDRYVCVPTKRDLDLGSRLPRRFAWQHLDEADAELVMEYFHHPGAYRRFRELLERRDKDDEWHAFEDEATRAVLTEWAEEFEIEIDFDTPTDTR